MMQVYKTAAADRNAVRYCIVTLCKHAVHAAGSEHTVVHNTYQPFVRWVEMYIGFIWLTTSLVILLAACINRDTHLQSRTRRHGPHTDQLFCNWHCLAVRRSLCEGPMVWLSRAKQGQISSVTESPKWEKNSAGSCVLCDAARWLHLQDVARIDGAPVHAIRRSPSSFYWAQKRPTNCQLHYVQVSCFFGQQLWQLRTAMYLPLLKCVWISQMFSKIGRIFFYNEFHPLYGK